MNSDIPFVVSGDFEAKLTEGTPLILESLNVVFSEVRSGVGVVPLRTLFTPGISFTAFFNLFPNPKITPPNTLFKARKILDSFKRYLSPFFRKASSFSLASPNTLKIARPFGFFWLLTCVGVSSRLVFLAASTNSFLISSGVAGSKNPPCLVRWLNASSEATRTSSRVTSVLFSKAANVMAALLMTISGLMPSTLRSKQALHMLSRRYSRIFTSGRIFLA